MKNTPFVFVLSDSQSLVQDHDNLSTHPSTGPSNNIIIVILYIYILLSNKGVCSVAGVHQYADAAPHQ